jgi:hypothetical protein
VVNVLKWQIRYHEHSQRLGSGSQNWTTPKCKHGHSTWMTKQSQWKRRIPKRNHDSEWAATTFIQPNKAAKERALTNFRQLNQEHKRQPFPLPKYQQKKLEKVYSNGPEYGQKGSQRLGQQPIPGETTHGSRRDTRHLPVHIMDKNGRH